MIASKLLMDLAESVSSGRPIDGDAALAEAADQHERGVIENMLAIAKIASASGGLLEEAAEDTSGEPETPAAWGHLEILRRVGAGSFGEVFLAEDRQLGRRVALKLLHPKRLRDPEMAATILNEGRLLARLRHPNIVTVFGADTHDDRVGIWMEYVEGQTLEATITGQGPFAANEAALIGIDVCRALAAVHKAGLMHCDVKAHNIVREQGGRIMLMDFGSGIAANMADLGGRVTGTPIYMAPELFTGAANSERSEIYSVGVLLFHLVTGEFPVRAGDLQELRAAHEEQRYVLLGDARPELPPDFVRVVEKALAPEASNRHATAGQLQSALGHALGQDQCDPDPAAVGGAGSATAGHGRSGRRTTQLIALLALVAVVTGVILVQVLRPADSGGVPYTIEAAVFRRADAGDERLIPGAEIGIGDRLFIEFRSSRELHVYVLNEDTEGHAHLLFPMPGSDLINPLDADLVHRLPGAEDGERLNWVVDSAGGREHLLIIASPSQLTEFETRVASLALSLPEDQSASLLDDAAAELLRGVGSVERERPVAGAEAPRLFEMARQILDSPEEVRGIWSRQIELRNSVGP